MSQKHWRSYLERWAKIFPYWLKLKSYRSTTCYYFLSQMVMRITSKIKFRHATNSLPNSLTALTHYLDILTTHSVSFDDNIFNFRQRDFYSIWMKEEENMHALRRKWELIYGYNFVAWETVYSHRQQVALHARPKYSFFFFFHL